MSKKLRLNFFDRVKVFTLIISKIRNFPRYTLWSVYNEKTAEVLKAEKIVEQAKARLAEAKRKASQQKRKEENQHKYMMGGIVHKYFPECYQFDEQELNRIIASGMKSEQCQRIIEIVKKESAEKRENAVVKAESEVAGDEGTGKSENA